MSRGRARDGDEANTHQTRPKLAATERERLTDADQSHEQQPFATTICHDHSQPRYGSLGETLMSFLFESVTVLVCVFTENVGLRAPLKHGIKGLCAVSSILLGSHCSNLVLGRGQEH